MSLLTWGLKGVDENTQERIKFLLEEEQRHGKEKSWGWGQLSPELSFSGSSSKRIGWKRGKWSWNAFGFKSVGLCLVDPEVASHMNPMYFWWVTVSSIHRRFEGIRIGLGGPVRKLLQWHSQELVSRAAKDGEKGTWDPKLWLAEVTQSTQTDRALVYCCLPDSHRVPWAWGIGWWLCSKRASERTLPTSFYALAALLVL